MTVTDVKIRHIFESPEEKVKAIVSIVLDGEFAVHGLKIIDGVQRLFVAMPNRKSSDGRVRDIVHPIIPETREKIESAVLKAYNAEIDRLSGDSTKQNK